jgi:hypothetical protein
MHRSFDLPRIAMLLCIALLAGEFVNLITRSVWVDEAMLLKAIMELKSPTDFMKPLAYYDQAVPTLVSLYFKAAMSVVDHDIRALRLAVLLLSCMLISPMLLIFKGYRWGIAIFLLMLVSHEFSTGLYLTELKHYFLEVCGSFLAVFGIYKAQERHSPYWPAAMAAVISTMGFSTLVVSAGLLVYGFSMCVTKPWDKSTFRELTVLVICALVVVAEYLFMKYLTLYQIGNYQQYYASSALDSLPILAKAIVGAYGKALLLTSAVASLALLFSMPRGFAFKLNVFFIGLVTFVVIGRVTGFYPVNTSRHLIWLAPFSLVIVSLAILEFVASPKLYAKALGWLMLAIVSLQAIKMAGSVIKGVNYEYVDNNHFYRFIADMPPTRFLVYPDAQPSLEYYSLLLPQLNKHQYVRVDDEVTRKRDPSRAQAEYEDSLVEMLRQRQDADFSVLVSHVNLDTDITGRGTALEAKIARMHCTYVSYFYVYNAQLIRVHCPADAEL